MNRAPPIACCLQGAHGQEGQASDTPAKTTSPGQYCKRIGALLETRLRLRLREAPVQFGDEGRVAFIEPLLHHHALPRGRHDRELGRARGPDFGEKAVRLHAGGTKRQPHAIDVAPRHAARICGRRSTQARARRGGTRAARRAARAGSYRYFPAAEPRCHHSCAVSPAIPCFPPLTMMTVGFERRARKPVRVFPSPKVYNILRAQGL